MHLCLHVNNHYAYKNCIVQVYVNQSDMLSWGPTSIGVHMQRLCVVEQTQHDHMIRNDHHNF